MRRELRAVMVAALATVLVIDPATACHYYGYYSGYSGSCGSYCGPVSCCGGCGGCGGYEVVDCGPCGCDGGAVDNEPSNDAAPHEQYEPYGRGGDQTMPHSGPANVRRPVDRMPPPQLPAAPHQPSPEPMGPSRTEPMTTKPAPRATPSADELFGPPSKPAAKPANDMFKPSAEPMAPPAEAQPSTSRDTTGTEPTTERYAVPAEQPSEPGSDNRVGPADSGPAKPETTDEPLSVPSFDDFFSTPPAETATPTEETPKEDDEQPAPAEGEDDLFNFGAVLREPGGFASTALRQWVDNTGRYSCRGRLLRVLDGKVQLLKDTGRTTTVPFGRLSQNDIQFVHRQASAQRAEAVGQTAQVVSLRPAH